MRPLLRTALVAALAVGCGKPATKEQCEEIAERIVRLELAKESGGLPVDERRVLEERAKHAERAERDCVGKRVTPEAMQCVRGAKTSEEIVEQCFR
ncbi:MAG: hypothetical protein IT376_03560 [Polyangiaceae bacterium]|nr:hypothetical protein [Polyangiaceae bacterium]